MLNHAIERRMNAMEQKQTAQQSVRFEKLETELKTCLDQLTAKDEKTAALERAREEHRGRVDQCYQRETELMELRQDLIRTKEAWVNARLGLPQEI